MNDRRAGVRTLQLAGLGILAGLGFLLASAWWAEATWWTWLGGSLLVGMLTWIFVFELLQLSRRK